MKYLIVKTWNGEGYSDSENNNASVAEAISPEAILDCLHTLVDDEEPDGSGRVETSDGSIRIEYEIDGDFGSYNAIELVEPVFGVRISAEDNEFTVFESDDDYFIALTQAMSEGNPDDVSEIEDTHAEHIYIGAEYDDYSYHFVRLIKQ